MSDLLLLLRPVEQTQAVPLKQALPGSVVRLHLLDSPFRLSAVQLKQPPVERIRLALAHEVMTVRELAYAVRLKQERVKGLLSELIERKEVGAETVGRTLMYFLEEG